MAKPTMQNLEADLWEAADQLRANSKLTANEYSQPVLGLIFLRHAYNRFLMIKAEIEPTLPMRSGVRAPLQASHFQGKAAIFLPEKAQYSYLVNLPEDQDIGKALVEAMELIEAQVPMLSGALPKEYTRFEPKLLRDLLRIFNRDALQNANGDVFGRIYEYFLNKFAMSGAQEGGEFLTPPSLVRLIVNVIEPDHGIVFDPACGSGGMFVWTGYFLNEQGTEPSKAVTIYGQEKAETNTRLSRMNLAVHGLEGQIVEANTFYDRHLDLAGRKLSVRNGKGMKDRTVYLTDTVVHAVKEYLGVRGQGPTDHVFLYRNQALSKDLIHGRLRAAGERIGVHVHAHRLRHTCTTQLLNAGCRITSIQKFLGHKRLNTTLTYARVHDQTVAEDYYAAMSSVEKRLDLLGKEEEAPQEVSENEREALLAFTNQMLSPKISLELCLEVAIQMKTMLTISVPIPVNIRNSKARQDHPPPIRL